MLNGLVLRALPSLSALPPVRLVPPPLAPSRRPYVNPLARGMSASLPRSSRSFRRRARSCVCLNLSKSSGHLTSLAALSRLRLRRAATAPVGAGGMFDDAIPDTPLYQDGRISNSFLLLTKLESMGHNDIRWSCRRRHGSWRMKQAYC